MPSFGDTSLPHAHEAIRRDFAHAWGRIGEAWGVAPSTAAVQGYLLLHGGPLTEAEVRSALGFSPRAVRIALASAEAWGIVERAPEARRSGRRGPAGAAWVPVDDHWEWFRRVAGARKGRETDPVLEVLQRCSERTAQLPRDDETRVLRARVESLLAFTKQFDRAVSAVVRADAAALRTFFGVLGRLDDATLDRLLAALAGLPEDELAVAARNVSRLPPRLMRGLLALGAQPGLARLLRGR